MDEMGVNCCFVFGIDQRENERHPKVYLIAAIEKLKSLYPTAL